MERGKSAGGGQSSLGYLFGSENKEKDGAAPPHPPPTFMPPYGIDMGDDGGKRSEIDNRMLKGQKNSVNFITDRPSTKVKSAPGGDSSLGYLFGDKS